MTDKSEMAFKQGDEVTIVRGKLKGLTGNVLGVDTEADKYAVQTADGSFAVVNAVNVKVPEEPTLTLSQVRALLERNGLDADAMLATD